MIDTLNKRRPISGCALTAFLTLGVVILAMVVGVFLVNKAFTNFESYRETMCIREGLVVKDKNVRYSPGFDAAMWCRFTAKVNGIDEIFDTSKVDTSEFSQADYKIQVDWITDEWWDVDDHQLIGGEVEIGNDWMRVGYVDHGDGTLTVYIFWFEV